MKEIIALALLCLMISTPAMGKGGIWYALNPNYAIASGLCADAKSTPKEYAKTLFQYSQKMPQITALEGGKMIVVYYRGGGPYTAAFFKDKDECQAYLAMAKMFQGDH